MLDLSGYTKVHSEIFTVLERCVNLTELTPFKLPSRLFVHLFLEKITPNIRKLNLSFTEDVTDDAIEILVKKCKKLTALNLRLTSITEISLDLIINYCTELEALDVTQNGLFDCSCSHSTHERNPNIVCNAHHYDCLADLFSTW